MEFILIPLRPNDKEEFMKEMKHSFQKGTEDVFGKTDKVVLPDADIIRSLGEKGATAYEAIVDGRLAGGAIVVIDEGGKRNHLDFLFVRDGMQGMGIGKKIWEMLEHIYPAEVWETVTPYFEKRNIHFYINVCGFSAVEFFNPHHRDPSIPDDMIGGDYFFRFEKNSENGLKNNDHD